MPLSDVSMYRKEKSSIARRQELGKGRFYTMSKRVTSVLCFLIPAVYLGMVLVFDRAAPYRTVSPPLCTMGLLIMCVMLNSRCMAFWAIIYSAVVMAILLDPKYFNMVNSGYLPPETTSHCFRVLGFLATACFSCVFSIILNKLREKGKALTRLISSIPLPVIVTDKDGRINLMNEKARSMFTRSSDKNLCNLDFFELLAHLSTQESWKAVYHELFKTGEIPKTYPTMEVMGKEVIPHFGFMDYKPRQLITILVTPGER